MKLRDEEEGSGMWSLIPDQHILPIREVEHSVPENYYISLVIRLVFDCKTIPKSLDLSLKCFGRVNPSQNKIPQASVHIEMWVCSRHGKLFYR